MDISGRNSGLIDESHGIQDKSEESPRKEKIKWNDENRTRKLTLSENFEGPGDISLTCVKERCSLSRIQTNTSSHCGTCVVVVVLFQQHVSLNFNR